MANINEEFISCVKTGDINAVVALLASGADIHYDDDRALRYSINSGRLDVVTKLLEFGADVNAHNNFHHCFSALEDGVDGGNLDMVNKLLEYGADVHSCDDYALLLSIMRNHFEIATTLLENGANVHCNNARILKNLLINFNEQAADVILPYCDMRNYEYFPSDYIRAKLMPTKSARTDRT